MRGTVTAYGKTILFEIDTSGIDLITLPSLVHRANRPQTLFIFFKHWAFILTLEYLLLLSKIYPMKLLWGTKKMMVFSVKSESNFNCMTC